MKVIGSVFADRWEVLEALAEGSTSEVFRGRDRTTGEPAAIKVLRPEFAGSGESLQRFRREARVAQVLSHPHIVAVRDSGVDGDHPWLAMELLEGETLLTRLERGKFPREQVLDLVDQIAAAVDHAHAAGFVHRDLKPDNCFLVAGDGSVNVKVLDFGFAKILNALQSDGLATASNALLGTPLYMAPEQIRSSATVDGRADLWSLGVMTYELLTGVPPFEAPSTADLLVEILTKRITALSVRDATLSRAVDRWAARALSRDPLKRFETASDFARALRVAMDPALARADMATAKHETVRPKAAPAAPRWLPLMLCALGVLAVIVVAFLR